MTDETHSFWLINIVRVSDEWRGTGLAERLLAEIVEKALELEVPRVIMICDIFNKEANDFTRKVGMEDTGFFKWGKGFHSKEAMVGFLKKFSEITKLENIINNN